MIRQAKSDDSKALSELARETYTAAFGHSFTPADLAAHLERNLSPQNFGQMSAEDTILVAEVNVRMVGFVQFGPGSLDGEAASGNDQELRRLYVQAEFQNKSIGTLLMSVALEHPILKHAERIFLDVWEHNPGAQRFYERHGFIVMGKREFVVESGAETSCDLIMVRQQGSNI
jgi:diamine N-acetyltransferase